MFSVVRLENHNHGKHGRRKKTQKQDRKIDFSDTFLLMGLKKALAKILKVNFLNGFSRSPFENLSFFLFFRVFRVISGYLLFNHEIHEKTRIKSKKREKQFDFESFENLSFLSFFRVFRVFRGFYSLNF